VIGKAALAAAHATTADDKKVAARQLEAFFLRQVLAEARAGGGQGLDAGFAGDTFKAMLDEAVADKVAGAGGVGLAQMFAHQLGDTAPAETAGAHAHAPLAPMAPSPDAVMPGAPSLILPVAGRPSSGYGMRLDPLQHKEIAHPGFDLAAKPGTPVSAAAAGEVTHAGPAGTYGNLVIVKHASGFETRYAHLSAVSVRVGQQVQSGDQVGQVGTTGYSTGPHLHFELRHDGHPMDPAPLLPLDSTRSRSNP
jgi:murein DD-endopeptidase MepM/ murein hydrolase activator NlpD